MDETLTERRAVKQIGSRLAGEHSRKLGYNSPPSVQECCKGSQGPKPSEWSDHFIIAGSAGHRTSDHSSYIRCADWPLVWEVFQLFEKSRFGRSDKEAKLSNGKWKQGESNRLRLGEF